MRAHRLKSAVQAGACVHACGRLIHADRSVLLTRVPACSTVASTFYCTATVVLNRGYMCNYCMQRAAIPACNNCRLSNVFENIHQPKVFQPMTAFGRIT